MRHFTARRLALAALVPALLLLSVIPGCSNEGEGERCGDEDGLTNNDDCQSGLTCTPIPLNNGMEQNVGRCCYTDHHVTDSRCAITTGVSATGGAGAAGTGGAGSSSLSTAGTSNAGAAGAAGAAEAAGAGGA